MKPRAPGTFGRTFLKEWREHANLTQALAASRIGEFTGEGLSHSQLSRIERGEQPYSQAILEAAADAYGTDPASILMRNPKDPDAIWSIWEQALPGERLIILDTAQAIIRRRAG
jgi:transcriptional regulator with XRE-family HTH domain